MSLAESFARDAHAKLLELVRKVLALLQQMDGKQLVQETIQRVLQGKNSVEASIGLFALDYVFSWGYRAGIAESSSVFGKGLIALNGYNLLSLAWQDRAATVWKELAGLSLEGTDGEALGTLALNMLGATGLMGVLSGLTGPGNHVLATLSLALTKLGFAFFLVKRATIAQELNTKMDLSRALELGRYHARTGAVVLAYSLLLIWKGKAKSNTPTYITELEKRVLDRLDQVMSVVKDQKSRSDSSAPLSTTPKKY